ncbi:MAG: cobalt ECF transporter T component CbiQ [bacterium]
MEWSELMYMGGGDSTNPINCVDPRVKILFALSGIALILLAGNLYVPAYFLSLAVVLGIMADIDYHQFLVRLVAPFLVISVLLVIQSFYYGTTPLYRFEVFGFEPTIYREGVRRGILLGLRVAGGVSLLILLSLTSTVLNLLSALKYFFVPRLWLEIMFLSYRYLFVFLSHVLTTFQAQKTRLGYRDSATSLSSLGSLAGHLFLHIFDQTRRTHEAMRMRGYRGTLPVPDVTGTPDVMPVVLGIILLVPGGYLWLGM